MINSVPLVAPTNQFYEGWYMLFTGCAASQVVATLEISYTYEFTPNDTYTIICPQRFPSQGSATLTAITNALA
jgi:hypothetical protein